MKPEGFSIEQVQYRTKNEASPEPTLRYAVRRGDQLEVIRSGFTIRPRVGIVGLFR